MTDIVDAQTRSAMMAGIRGKNTKPEMLVRRFLHRSGFRFRLHSRDLPGRPDIVLSRYRTVVEVRGCFWHRHEDCPFAYMPKSNRAFWQAKLNGNRERDLRNLQKLRDLGWQAIEIWECELAEDRVLEALPPLIRAGPDLQVGGLPA